jgi:hypothetical protein
VAEVARVNVDTVIRSWLTTDLDLTDRVGWFSRVCPDCIVHQHLVGMLPVAE